MRCAGYLRVVREMYVNIIVVYFDIVINYNNPTIAVCRETVARRLGVSVDIVPPTVSYRTWVGNIAICVGSGGYPSCVYFSFPGSDRRRI